MIKQILVLIPFCAGSFSNLPRSAEALQGRVLIPFCAGSFSNLSCSAKALQG